MSRTPCAAARLSARAPRAGRRRALPAKPRGFGPTSKLQVGGRSGAAAWARLLHIAGLRRAGGQLRQDGHLRARGRRQRGLQHAQRAGQARGGGRERRGRRIARAGLARGRPQRVAGSAPATSAASWKSEPGPPGACAPLLCPIASAPVPQLGRARVTHQRDTAGC